VKVITAGLGQLARLFECGLRGFAAVNQLAVLAHGFNGETHFFFFFFFRFSTSACARKASARDFIWSATKELAVWVATRSAVFACFRMAFVIPISNQFAKFEVVPAESPKRWVELFFTADVEYRDVTSE
jgi:hypothetical protein